MKKTGDYSCTCYYIVKKAIDANDNSDIIPDKHERELPEDIVLAAKTYFDP
jgi:hypothetical protein